MGLRYRVDPRQLKKRPPHGITNAKGLRGHLDLLAGAQKPVCFNISTFYSTRPLQIDYAASPGPS